MIGRSLSHYRITEKLGQGGMGAVYRAEDANLSRQVAIKLLPDEFAHDAERLARFEREAKLLASLNHPNLAAIYGLEQADGRPFLILELVEGQTLAERIKKGRIPPDEALDICRQIAEGLEAAHEKGVIHRDLKPSNVKVTPDGKVKILDFGLAKALQGEPSSPEVSRSPTLTSRMSQAGIALGTAAYMSPEQARARPVDRRADIWAFGCVLYECLTGKRAFEGETATETMATILKSDPDWTLLPAEIPAIVRSVLRQCLQKDPSLRLHDVADFCVEMQAEMGLPAEPVPTSRRFSLGWALGIAAVALACGILIGLAVRKYPQSSASVPLVASVIKLEPGYCLSGMFGGGRTNPYGYDHPTRTAIAVSSDGRFIIYSAIRERAEPRDKPILYLRKTHELEAKPIQGTEGGISPFLSPDDRWIGFWADGKLMKVSVEGGVPATLCNVPPDFGFSWGADNRIVFSPGSDTGLSTVSAVGGKPETLTIPDPSKEEYSHRLPHCLPGLKGILVTVTKQAWDMHPRVFLLEPAGRKWRVLLEDAADARYVPTGHMVFLRQGTLMAVPFDASRLEITGQPVPATANVMQALNMGDSDSNTAAGQFSTSASGSLVYIAGGILPDLENSLVWVDQKGQSEPVASFRAPFFAPRLSPDGRRIAYRTLAKDRQVWVYDLQRDTATRLTSEGRVSYAAWARDGQRVVFGWSKAGSTNLCWQAADGSTPIERLTTSEGEQSPGSWSADGETLAFVTQRPDGPSRSIQLLRVKDRQVTPFLNSRFDEMFPELSPDGRWIAYASDESGRAEVYVQKFPVAGGKRQISSKGGGQPLWSPDGKELFYRLGDQVWMVEVQAGSAFFAGKPRLVFEQPGFSSGAPIRGWDISLDGRRFLMVKLEERKLEPVTELILVQNWFEELKRLCPKGK